jgi:long-chain acyl-CoA synthetase
MFFNIQHHVQRDAIITNKSKLTYTELQELADNYDFQSSNKELIVLLGDHEVEIVAAYVSALQARHAVMLLSPTMNSDLLAQIVENYQPRWIVAFNEDRKVNFHGYCQNDKVLEREEQTKMEIYGELAVLLSTSGTTGSHKFVRLSYHNLQANAEAIAQYLELCQDERAILNLPLSYSYGLSILNSHLQVGAAVLLTGESVITKSFWNFVQEQQATSLPGVPFTYQLLQRVGFMGMNLPYLSTLTQAGGRLDQRLVQLFGEYARDNDKRFYVMYGQTEAAPRISYVPSEKLLEKPSAIGIAVPGGKLELDPDSNELIYYGDNVMLGYAESLDDLAKGDVCNGVLHTGDVAVVDEDGFFTITGRMKRFIKLFGLRINLDEVERKLEALLQQPIACVGNDDRLIIATESESLVTEIKRHIHELYKLHATAYRVKVLEQIPRMANGKTNYGALKDES